MIEMKKGKKTYLIAEHRVEKLLRRGFVIVETPKVPAKDNAADQGE